jgi:hypothetical protein
MTCAKKARGEGNPFPCDVGVVARLQGGRDYTQKNPKLIYLHGMTMLIEAKSLFHR